MHRSTPCFAAVVLALALAPSAVQATPLDIEACDRLVQQEAALQQAGARDVLAKGPAWAKANASADKIEQVRQLIEIEEQIQFRCLRTKPLPPQSVQALPPPPVAVVQPVKPKVRPKQVAASTEAGSTGDSAAPAAAAKPKPKVVTPKPADAYAPPPSGQ